MKKLQILTKEKIVEANGKKTSGIMIIDGKEVYVETYGKIENPPIAFLHGGPGTSCVEQAEMAELLGEKCFIVSFDQYGVMRSGAIEKNEIFGMKEHVIQIEGIREALGIEKWSLLGHSYGGMLVCYYTYMCPKSIISSMYENPSWNFMKSFKSIVKYIIDNYFEYHKDSEGYEIAKSLLQKDYSGCEKDSVWDILKLQPYVKDKRVIFYMHTAQPEDYFPLFEKCYEDFDIDVEMADQKELMHVKKLVEAGEMLEDHMYKIAENKQPALLIVGKYDPVCTIEQQKFFLDNAPNGKIVVLQNSAHHPRLEDKEEYKQAVFDFIKEVYN